MLLGYNFSINFKIVFFCFTNPLIVKDLEKKNSRDIENCSKIFEKKIHSLSLHSSGMLEQVR